MEGAPKRKDIRLAEYDYSQNGFYFVTVCTRDKQPIFWETPPAEKRDPAVVGADASVRPQTGMDATPPETLSQIGKIVKQCWENINAIYPNVRTDYYVIMPDHFHGMIVIDDPVRPSPVAAVVGADIVSRVTSSTVVQGHHPQVTALQ